MLYSRGELSIVEQRKHVSRTRALLGVTLLIVFAITGYGQVAPAISGITTTPNTGFDSGSVALAPGSTATISGTNLADSTTSAAAPGQSRLGGLEVHLVD